MNVPRRLSPGLDRAPVGLAAVVDEFWPGSHSDQIIRRLNHGFELLWTPMRGMTRVTDLYVDHRGDARADAGDGVRSHPDVRTALTRAAQHDEFGGVVLIPERNKRSGRPVPLDRRGHPVDLRRQFFDEVIDLLVSAKRRVPLFIDKYLGCTWEDAWHVFTTCRDLEVPLMAGSSLPYTVRCPPDVLPEGAQPEEVVVLSTGFGEAVSFHPLELVQSLVERRPGGETGVSHVTYLDQGAFVQAWRQGTHWSHQLVEAALAEVPHRRVGVLDALGAPASSVPSGPPLPAPTGKGEAIVVEYNDGLRLSILRLTGYMLRRSAAFRVRGDTAPHVTWTPTGAKLTEGVEMMGPLVPAPGQPKPRTWNFDHLTFFVDRFLATGSAPHPIERNLLTNGVIDAAMESRAQRGQRLPTPHLNISYKPLTTQEPQ